MKTANQKALDIIAGFLSATLGALLIISLREGSAMHVFGETIGLIVCSLACTGLALLACLKLKRKWARKLGTLIVPSFLYAFLYVCILDDILVFSLVLLYPIMVGLGIYSAEKHKGYDPIEGPPDSAAF